MRGTLLPLGLALACGIGMSPARADSECQEVCFDAETMLPVDCSAVHDAMLKVREASEKWECDIRSWTRAPDLIPGTHMPGQTRLAMNGTGCQDIVKWELGLRHKERAIIKMRKPDVEFPVKPIRKPYNATARAERNLERDLNDIYAGSGWGYARYRDQDRQEYDEQMKAYNDAIRNKTLFDVHGKERVVFDATIDLQLDVIGDEGVTDQVRPFSVKVPFTNFPPMHARQPTMRSGGKDAQMLGSEDMFEYYHLLHLANGTTLDRPAGRSSFLTEPRRVDFPKDEPRLWHDDQGAQTPLSADKVPQQGVQGLVHLQSPKTGESAPNNNETDSGLANLLVEPGFERDQGPQCARQQLTRQDRDYQASFSVQITSNVTEVVPNSNMTVTVHLTRHGNGTEYPAFIDIGLAFNENLTFAYDYISSDEAYKNLQSDPGRSFGPVLNNHARMLLVKSQKDLEKQREQSQSTGGYSTHYMGRWPVADDVTRYDFEEIYDRVGDKEEYTFDVDIHVPYDALPSFGKTFSRMVSQLRFDLHTTFLCALPAKEDEAELSTGEKLDNEWEEYQLPLDRKNSRGKGASAGYFRSLRHEGVIDVEITRPSNLDSDQQAKLKHYLDSDAKAPILSHESLSATRLLKDDTDLPMVDLTIRDEEEHELKQSRYDLYRSGRQHQPRCHGGPGQGGCWNRNNGGGGSHAAKLWQRKEREQQGVMTGH